MSNGRAKRETRGICDDCFFWCLLDFGNLLLCPCLENEGLAPLHVFLHAHAGIYCNQVFLLKSNRVGNQDVRFLGRSGPNGALFGFGHIRTIQFTVDVVHYSRKRPAPSTAFQNQWKTVSILFETLTKPIAKTKDTASAPRIDLTSDEGNNQNCKES